MVVDEIDTAVTAAILDYEEATLYALHVLDGQDPQQMKIACLGFVNTLSVLRGMPRTDREFALALLIKRGRIPDHAWDVIGAALELFHLSDRLDDMPINH